MEENLITGISSSDGLIVQMGILSLLILGGFFFPIPEDIPLLLGGVAVSKSVVSAQAMFFTCYLGVLGSDLILFFIGYILGQRLVDASTKSKLLPSVTPEKVEKVRKGLHKRKLIYILVARHLFFVRSLTFVIAGSLRIPTTEFLLADSIAALFSVSLMMGIGYWVGESITPSAMDEITRQTQFYIFLIVAIAAICLLAHRLYKNGRQNASEKNVSESNQSLNV